jgi:hypothetical protein
MQLQEMYPALINSVATALTGAIGAGDTTLFILDDSRIPEPPNLLVIGENSALAETVKLTAKDGNQLTVVRGFQGAAKAWSAGTSVSRNFTAYDHDTFRANVETLADGQDDHEASALPHVTADGAYNYGFRVNGGNLVFCYEERGDSGE